MDHGRVVAIAAISGFGLVVLWRLARHVGSNGMIEIGEGAMHKSRLGGLIIDCRTDDLERIPS